MSRVFGPVPPPPPGASSSKTLPDEEISTLSHHKGAVFVVRLSQTGQYCLTGGKDRDVVLWNPHRGSVIKTYSDVHRYDIHDIQLTDDNATFASCGGADIYLWDVASGEVTRRIRGHEQRVNSLSFSSATSGHSVLASGSYDRSVKLWDLRASSRDPIQTMSEASDSVETVQWCGEDRIWTASIDGNLRCYDVRMCQLTTDCVAGPWSSQSLRASPHSSN